MAAKRIISFDIIRGISALLVLLFHYTVRFNEFAINGMQFNLPFGLKIGYAAVITFFVLSGYFSSKTLYSRSNVSWYGYLWRRLKRLYPAFLIAVIMTFSITKLFMPVLSVSLKDFILNLSMMPGLLGAKPVDGAYWTLFIEWMFYFLVAVLLMLPRKTMISDVVLILWILVSIVSVVLWGKDPSGLPKVLDYFAVTSYCSCFVLGVALWRLQDFEAPLIPLVMIGLSILNAVLWQDVTSVITLIITGALIFLITHTNMDATLSRSKIMNIFAWYGRISYSLYLVHQIIGYVVLFFLLNFGVPPMLALLSTVAVATALGSFVNWAAEKFTLYLNHA